MSFLIKKYGTKIPEDIEKMLKWFKLNNKSVYREIQKVIQKHRLY